METPVKFAGDRKVTNHATQKGELGTAATVNDKNSFGLSASRCTNRTPFCDSCYAESTERQWPTVRNALEHNWEVIEPHLDNWSKLYDLLSVGVKESIEQKIKRNVPVDKWQFRWFWDGDIPSQAFAEAMRLIARNNPKVKFWVYTRCFQYAPTLYADNLAVYLSTDMYNWQWAVKVKSANPHVHYAFNGRDWAETQWVAELCEEPRGLKCPEQVGRVDLVEWSQETTKAGKYIGEGACAKCDYCTVGKGNVRFAINPK
tara:strand:- start:2036 stop:2812 length:777 start_codon:yes stop_codon:yes gene_type:complete